MVKQIALALAVSFVFIGTLAGIKFLQISAAIAEGKSRQMPPDTVTTVVVTEQQWPVTREAVGTLAPVFGTMLSSEEFGRVSKVDFESGARVTAGQILVELDTSVEQAQLAGAKAQLELANIVAKRQRTLREKNANAQSDLDSAEATLRNADAEVGRLQAIIERKKIRAPFAGVTGIRAVNVGQTISAGTEVVSLQSYDQLYVNFSLPQNALAHVESGSKVEIRVDAFAGETFAGTLTAVEPQVNIATRNVSLQATLTNSDGRLRPGMFANVTVILPQVEKVLALPISSISYAPYGDSVFIVDAAKDGALATVRPQTIKAGRKLGDLTAILSGLKIGDEVVTSGVFKLRPGGSVVVDNSVTPGANTHPTPADT